MPLYECAMCPASARPHLPTMMHGRLHMRVEHKCDDAALVDLLLRTIDDVEGNPFDALPPSIVPQQAPAPPTVRVERAIKEDTEETQSFSDMVRVAQTPSSIHVQSSSGLHGGSPARKRQRPVLTPTDDNVVSSAASSPSPTDVKPARHRCDLCDKAFVTAARAAQHLLFVHDVVGAKDGFFDEPYYAARPYRCTYCPHAFLTLMVLTTHDRAVHKARAGLLACADCPRRFNHAHGLTLHSQRVHWMMPTGGTFVDDSDTPQPSVDAADTTTDVSTPPAVKRTNPHPSKIVFDADYYATHPLKCAYCPMGYAHTHSRARHMKKAHFHVGNMPSQRVLSDDDDVTPIDTTPTTLGKRARRPDPPAACAHCPMVFSRDRGRLRHMRHAHKEVTQLATDYEAGTGDDMTPTAAFVKHEPAERPFACAHCPMTFTRTSDRARHDRHVHTVLSNLPTDYGVGNGTPPTVPARARAPAATLVMDDEYYSTRSHRCRYCARAFANGTNWSNHMRNMHNVEYKRDHYASRPFKCTAADCDKAFRRRAGMVQHIRTFHKDEATTAIIEAAPAAATTTVAPPPTLEAEHRADDTPPDDAANTVTDEAADTQTDAAALADYYATRPYRCSETDCTKAYPSSVGLSNHRRLVHRRAAAAVDDDDRVSMVVTTPPLLPLLAVTAPLAAFQPPQPMMQQAVMMNNVDMRALPPVGGYPTWAPTPVNPPVANYQWLNMQQ